MGCNNMQDEKLDNFEDTGDVVPADSVAFRTRACSTFTVVMSQLTDIAAATNVLKECVIQLPDENKADRVVVDEVPDPSVVRFKEPSPPEAPVSKWKMAPVSARGIASSSAR